MEYVLNQNTRAGILNREISFTAKTDKSLSQKSFEEWRRYIYDISGIFFQDNKKYLLESRLQKRLDFLGFETFDQYYDYVRYNPNKNIEIRFLFEVITINETFFFRNQPQLDALVSSVLPELINLKTKACRNKIRIWSAASSTGEEAYSVAMVLLDLIKPKYPEIEIEIIGTDISHAVIETAKRGIYREYSVRNTPSYYLKKYFKPSGDSFELDPAVRKLVNFRMLNLYDDNGMGSMMNYDIIYCANVLIYFDIKSKIKVVSHLYNALIKGGFLFIGYSETLHGISKAFKLVSYPKTIGYKKE